MAVDRQTGEWILDGMKCKIAGLGANRRAVVDATFRAPMNDELAAVRSERRQAVRDGVRAAAEQAVDGMAEYGRLSRTLREQEAALTGIERDKSALVEGHEAAILAGDDDGAARAEKGLAEVGDRLAIANKRLGIVKDAIDSLAPELDLKLRKAVREAANARRIAILEELEEIEAAPPDAVLEWLGAVWFKREELAAADSFRDVYADRNAATAILAGAAE